MKNIISNLNGYLYALRRLSNGKCDFWAEMVELNDDVEASLRKHLTTYESDLEITSIETIDYEAVEAMLQDMLLSNLSITDEETLKLFGWDLVEYFGLASMLADQSKDKEFNPLVDNGALKISIKSPHHAQHVYFAVPIGGQAILTGLAVRGE